MEKIIGYSILAFILLLFYVISGKIIGYVPVAIMIVCSIIITVAMIYAIKLIA